MYRLFWTLKCLEGGIFLRKGQKGRETRQSALSSRRLKNAFHQCLQADALEQPHLLGTRVEMHVKAQPTCLPNKGKQLRYRPRGRILRSCSRNFQQVVHTLYKKRRTVLCTPRRTLFQFVDYSTVSLCKVPTSPTRRRRLYWGRWEWRPLESPA